VTARTANTTTAFVQDIFSDHIVGHGLWPSQSPDLVPPDFFLQRFLKEFSAVTQEGCWTLHVTLNMLLQALTNTPQKTMSNTVKGVNACLQEGGGHFLNLL
jgi:hypothetical protein